MIKLKVPHHLENNNFVSWAFHCMYINIVQSFIFCFDY